MTSTDILIFGLCGIAAGYLIHMLLSSIQRNSAMYEARHILSQAERDAGNVRRDAELQARAETIKAREELEAAMQVRRAELDGADTRLTQRETNLDRKVAVLDKKERALDARDEELVRRAQEVQREHDTVAQRQRDADARLQAIAGLTRIQARAELLAKTEIEERQGQAALVRRLQDEARETADREARLIVSQAVQRYASAHPAGLMTSTVPLPSDEMKGRIIGRDGRNIRTIEAATGVSLLVDDTPEAVVISAFDPIRREVARLALLQLVEDGRIHPARIEELVEKARADIDGQMRKAGEEAVLACGLQPLDPELQRVLGRLTFRTSYAQNVLAHSIEVAQLMGVMASELGLDAGLARRIGLLHDVGKALDHEVEGNHAEIGADLLRRHGESPVVVAAVAAHHEDVPVDGPYGWLVMAADALSAARPGARAVTAEHYIKRLERLEAVAASFPGVERVYAIQAGREVRVLVRPEQVNDAEAMDLARAISRRIEDELKYPGTIRVTVVRETRAVEYAR